MTLAKAKGRVWGDGIGGSFHSPRLCHVNDVRVSSLITYHSLGYLCFICENHRRITNSWTAMLLTESNFLYVYIHIYVYMFVKSTFEMLTVYGWKYSFSTDEWMFLKNHQRFWERKCLILGRFEPQTTGFIHNALTILTSGTRYFLFPIPRFLILAAAV